MATVWRLTRWALQFLLIAACAALLSACGSTTVTSTVPTAIDNCALTLTSPQSPITAAGGRQAVTLTTTRDCTWTASAEAPWIGRIDPSSGQGSGTLQIDVAPNPAPVARQTGILVNGVRALIQQLPAACDYAVSGSGSQSVAGAGNSFQLTVTTLAGCTWTAASSVTWVRVTAGSPGNGSGVVSFVVEANPGSERVAALTIAGQSFKVFQAASGSPASPVPPNSPGPPDSPVPPTAPGPPESPQPEPPGPCTYALDPVSLEVAAGAGTGSVSLTTTCAWTATADVSWITVTSPSGTGNAAVSFAVAVNTGPARGGTIHAGSATATITQAACTYALSPPSLGVAAAAGAGSLSLTTACGWTATADVPWITVTSPSGTGNAAVTFTVALNNGLARSGDISVGSATATITQAAAPLMATYSGTASGTHNFEVSGALSLAPGTYTLTFNRAGTVYVRGVAGGGGGGGGKRRDDGGSSTGGGGGGGGGAANLSGQSVSVVSGTAYAAVVGSGGSGGAGATEASGNTAENGTAGSETSFRIQGGTTYLQLSGGSGGGGGTAATGAGGAGGTTRAGVGLTGGDGGNGGGNFGQVQPQPGGGISGVSTGGGGGGGQSNEQSSTAGGAQGGQGGASGGAGGSGAHGGNAAGGITDSGAGGEGARDNNGDDSAGGGGGGGKGITVQGGPSNRGGGGGGGGAINTGNSSDRGGNGGAGGNGGMSIGIN